MIPYYPYQAMQPQTNYQQTNFPSQYQSQNYPQIQNSGFIQVRSEREAYEYPIAPGNSINFKDEYAPYVYVKTLGFNQMERPTFEKYRLVKEDMPSTSQNFAPQAREGENHPATPQYALKSDVDEIRASVEAIKAEIERKPKNREEIVEV